MTVDINDFYGVDVMHGKKVGPRQYLSKGTIFRRDTQETVGTVTGEGAAMTAADRRAVEAARRWVSGNGPPADWKQKRSFGAG